MCIAICVTPDNEIRRAKQAKNIFDLVTTGNVKIRRDTHVIKLFAVPSCGYLNIPDAIRQQPPSYVVGGAISVLNCMSGFEEFGTVYQYSCVQTSTYTAQWNPPQVGVQCVCKSYMNHITNIKRHLYRK